MPFFNPTTFGRTKLKVGRLGISSSFGAPIAAYDVDRGTDQAG